MWALCFYIRMTVWPVQNQPHYALQKGPLHIDVNDYLLPVVVVPVFVTVSLVIFTRFILTVSTISTSKQRGAKVTSTVLAATLCLVYIAMSVPALGFVQHGVPTMGADRYNYFSGAWVAVACAASIANLYTISENDAVKFGGLSIRDGKSISIVAVFTLLIVLTRSTTRPWTNTVSLYTFVVCVSGTHSLLWIRQCNLVS